MGKYQHRHRIVTPLTELPRNHEEMARAVTTVTMVTIPLPARSNIHSLRQLRVSLTMWSPLSRCGPHSSATPVGRRSSRQMGSAWSATRGRAPRNREVANEPAAALCPLWGAVRR